MQTRRRGEVESLRDIGVINVIDKNTVEKRMDVKPSAYPIFRPQFGPPDSNSTVVQSVAGLGIMHAEPKKTGRYCHLTNWPGTLKEHRWTTSQIIANLRNKVVAATTRKDQQYQKIVSRFKNAHRGESSSAAHQELDAEAFLRFLLDWNLCTTREQSDLVFREFDRDGDGSVTLREFFLTLVDDDYPDATEERLLQNTYRPQTQASWEACEKVESRGEKLYQMTHHNVWQALQDKISERVSRREDRRRQIYKFFSSVLTDDKTGIDRSGLKKLLFSFRIPSSEQERSMLFEFMDYDGDGILTFDEFINAIMPDDYPVTQREFDPHERFSDPSGISGRMHFPQKKKEFIDMLEKVKNRQSENVFEKEESEKTVDKEHSEEDLETRGSQKNVSEKLEFDQVEEGSEKTVSEKTSHEKTRSEKSEKERPKSEDKSETVSFETVSFANMP